MAERKIRCGIINLTERTVTVKELETDEIHPEAALKKELHSLFPDEKDTVILHTGILTGTGAPGTGMMIWYVLKENGTDVYFSEGKMGAFLRYAGFDTLVFTGKSAAKTVAAVRDGKIMVNQYPGNMESLKSEYGDEFGTIAAVDEKGMLEDEYYFIGGSDIADQLRKRNLAAVSIQGTGCIIPEKGDAFVKAAAKLWEECKKPVHSRVETIHRVRYLSAGNMPTEQGMEKYREILQNKEQAMAAFLGIYIPQAVPEEKMKDQITKLLEGMTGESIEWENLCEEDLNRIQKKGGQTV